jgi:hypothetical protein
MTPAPEPVTRPDQRPPALPRTVLFAGVALLGAGWVTGLAGGETSGPLVRLLVDMGLAAVVSVPILNVVAVMTVEWQRRHTAFAAAAAVVLTMLAVNVFWRG